MLRRVVATHGLNAVVVFYKIEDVFQLLADISGLL